MKFMKRNLLWGILRSNRTLPWIAATLVLVFAAALPQSASAQDYNSQDNQNQDDPPGRVARLGFMEGSVSFQPAGESEWVQAVPNRPMTTGDKLWADRDSRAEIQLGSSMIDLAPNTGVSFLNLDDRTVQLELSSGTVNVRVWNLDRDNVFEIDTANQAFTVYQPGRYRLDASEDGNSTVVTIREGQGESTGNGQSYTLHAGQRTIFTGTQTLNAEVEQLGGPDQFDNWSSGRERRYDQSPSARYCSRSVVGFEDLDDYGDWRPSPQYGYAWFPRVGGGWAPYHDGHWAWIDPWGWTWVDDARWGYAPFHYGRWFNMGGRWGWIPGPREERPVYAPALVAFVGGGFAVGATVGWFPLGPREVYVPSYRVSPAYVNRVNVTNTTVNVTQVTNVYNTTIVKNNTTINNVTYVNRNVRGGVTAMPQRAFASAQPVSRNAVAVNEQQMSRTPVVSRAAVAPVREAVLGPNAGTASRAAAPSQAIASRQVIAKATPPPQRASFAARQQVLTQNPGQPVNRQQLQQLRPASAPAPQVRQAPPGKPATATDRPGNQPGNPPANQPANQPGTPAGNARPGATPPPAAQPGSPNQPGGNTRPQPNRPFEPPARNDRPATAQPNNQPQPNQPGRPQPNQPEPNRPQPNQPEPNRPQPNRPEPNQPEPNRPQPNQPEPNRPQPNRPEPNQPEPNRPQPNNPAQPPSRNDRPPAAQPNNRPEPQPNNRPEMNQPPDSRPQPNQPAPRDARPDTRPDPNQPRANQPTPREPQPNNRPAPQPDTSRPQPNRPEPSGRNDRPSESQPNARPPQQQQPQQQPQRNERPQAAPPNDRPQARPDNRPPQQQRPQTPEEKKRQDEQDKKNNRPQ